MASEKTTNGYQTTLNGSISSGATSIVVTDGSGFPSLGDFVIQIDSELFLCTARSSNTLTVTPGQESTSQSAHSNSSIVSQVLSRGALLRLLAEAGAGISSTIPLVASFTTVTGGSVTITDTDSGILFTINANSTAQANYCKINTSGTAYTYIVGFKFLMKYTGDADQACFIGLMNSADSKTYHLAYYSQRSSNLDQGLFELAHSTFDTLSGPGSDATFGMIGTMQPVYLKVTRAGANITFYMSLDRAIWYTFATVTTAGFVGTPDRFVFGVIASSNSQSNGLVTAFDYALS